MAFLFFNFCLPFLKIVVLTCFHFTIRQLTNWNKSYLSKNWCTNISFANPRISVASFSAPNEPSVYTQNDVLLLLVGLLFWIYHSHTFHLTKYPYFFLYEKKAYWFSRGKSRMYVYHGISMLILLQKTSSDFNNTLLFMLEHFLGKLNIFCLCIKISNLISLKHIWSWKFSQ